MKIIVLRDGGFNKSVQLSRRRLGAIAAVGLVTLVAATGFITPYFQQDVVDAKVVSHWSTQLAEQDELVAKLERRSAAQSAAVGRQLAEMQARLLRMEAIGAHMVSDLDTPEFDFAKSPAQGGPVSGEQSTLAWDELQKEMVSLSSQLRKRETELNILDSVLVSKEIADDSNVAGRRPRGSGGTPGCR